MKDIKIDFVITWVDGSDKEWLKEKRKYNLKENKTDTKNRYRDMETLKYWFRSVEKFAPWVNKIYFITWGHIPKWLNTKNKKLVIVNHKDYIPSVYLPTYNSNCIELNIFRLKDLSENFVLFNDDMFIIRKMKKTDFFKNNLPCEEYAENINMPRGYYDYFSHLSLNNIGIVNKYFNKRKIMKTYFFKLINLKYGINNLRTLCLLPWKNFSLIYDPHLPVSLKKSQLKELWDIEYTACDNTCKNRFRENTDINQYLIRYFQLLKGKFIPRRHGVGQMYSLNSNIEQIRKVFKKRKIKMICLNDNETGYDFEKRKQDVINIFERKFPNKSSFEK